MPSQYARTYNSFSGIDIVPVFNGNAIGECQGISYSVSREKAPLYTLGSPNPRSFSRGKRGIAGAVVFLVFDRSALFDTMAEDSNFWGNKNERPANFANQVNSATPEQLSDINTFRASLGTAGAGLSNAESALGSGDIELENKVLQKAYYHDQIPPFDVKLIAATERGHGATMEILGMEILNCGSGISVDDITTDESCTWVGVNIIPWYAQTYNDPTSAAFTTGNGTTAGSTFNLSGNAGDAIL